MRRVEERIDYKTAWPKEWGETCAPHFGSTGLMKGRLQDAAGEGQFDYIRKEEKEGSKKDN